MESSAAVPGGCRAGVSPGTAGWEGPSVQRPHAVGGARRRHDSRQNAGATASRSIFTTAGSLSFRRYQRHCPCFVPDQSGFVKIAMMRNRRLRDDAPRCRPRTDRNHECFGAGILFFTSAPPSRPAECGGGRLAWRAAPPSEVSEDMPTTDIAEIDGCQCTTTSSGSGCNHPRSNECALLRLPSHRRRARAARETACRWWLAPQQTRDTPSS